MSCGSFFISVSCVEFSVAFYSLRFIFCFFALAPSSSVIAKTFFSDLDPGLSYHLIVDDEGEVLEGSVEYSHGQLYMHLDDDEELDVWLTGNHCYLIESQHKKITYYLKEDLSEMNPFLGALFEVLLLDKEEFSTPVGQWRYLSREGTAIELYWRQGERLIEDKEQGLSFRLDLNAVGPSHFSFSLPKAWSIEKGQ